MLNWFRVCLVCLGFLTTWALFFKQSFEERTNHRQPYNGWFLSNKWPDWRHIAMLNFLYPIGTYTSCSIRLLTSIILKLVRFLAFFMLLLLFYFIKVNHNWTITVIIIMIIIVITLKVIIIINCSVKTCLLQRKLNINYCNQWIVVFSPHGSRTTFIYLFNYLLVFVIFFTVACDSMTLEARHSVRSVKLCSLSLINSSVVAATLRTSNQIAAYS